MTAKAITICAGLVAGWVVAAEAQPDAAFQRDVAPFLKQHCIACHGPDKQKGKVRFDGPLPDLTDAKLSQQWLTAKRLIAQGDMPPEDKPRPKADEMVAVLAWIDDAAGRAATVTRGGVGRRALRRLTGREYVNTLHDLLGLHFPHATVDLSARLPSDAVANSFSNDSNQQVMQALQLRRSLNLAEDMLAVALPDEGEVRPLRYVVDLRPLAAAALAKFNALPEAERNRQGGVAIKGAAPSAIDGIGPAKLEIKGDRGNLSAMLRADHVDAQRGIMLEPNPILLGVNRNNISLLLPVVPDRGVLRLTVRAAALIECDDSTPVLRLSLGGPQAPGNATYPLAQMPVTPPRATTQDSGLKTQDYILEAPLALAEGDWASFRREKSLWVQIDNAAALLGPTQTPEKFDNKDRDKYLKRNRLLIESFTLEVVPSSTWPPMSETVLLAARQDEDEHARAKRSLAAFLAKAFRRPVREAELSAFHELYLAQRKAGSPFLPAYRTAIAAALISPQVQYLVEVKGDQREPLTAWELAARLSYLAWSTTPDAELAACAADGSLLTETVLRQQLHRLLAHERGLALAREFTRQWLDLDVLPHLEPPLLPLARWPDSGQEREWYGKVMRRDLAEEPAHYLLDALRNDRAVATLVQSDHVVVNDRLARYYGIADVRGNEWRRVPAPAARRGGLLTQAGCIAAATHAQERGEIKRGVYLVERVLGIDIPTPPGNVDIKPLDVQLAEDRKLRDLTPRQHMEKHRAIETCAVCHQRIDPLGFVWDEYDMYGQPKRDRQGKALPFNAAGQLPDKTAFATFDEFRTLLADESQARFAAAFSRRLYAYVLGRSLDHGDEKHLHAIREAAATNSGGLRSLLTAMVLSEPFRMK